MNTAGWGGGGGVHAAARATSLQALAIRYYLRFLATVIGLLNNGRTSTQADERSAQGTRSNLRLLVVRKDGSSEPIAT